MPRILVQPCIQLYTGAGKGKTTAAIGAVMRALGHKWYVCMLMFMKGEGIWDYGEKNSLAEYKDNLSIWQYGAHKPVEGAYSDSLSIQTGWLRAKKILYGILPYRLLVLDELTQCIQSGLIDIDEVVECLRGKPKRLSVIITGRNADQKLIDIADIVTEMHCVKHQFSINDTQARKGIEY